ncbi:hypothetical protein [Deinococcus hopiensis]|uniref:Uncharacterized protein n=1 Tax=Deinococcus hopiensis KR-140 TaxID=695939 RepID=A0A1W1UJW0_9DEIO|nr:hypothetical protein [Deinococcus hopiensis]SMB81303.1 hypothetical protein SAMN00790413_04533 [Deinococcus hopiensis KR-140]
MARDIWLNMQVISETLPFLPVAPPPDPWIRKACRAVGGLREVGFAPGSDLLLVVSSQGRGVVDCLTGELVAREREVPYDWVDERELLAEGIGPLKGQRIRIAGLAGGGLALGTADGLRLEIETFSHPERCVILKRSDWAEWPDAEKGCSKIAADSSLRAAGFSPTGRSLVIATSSEVIVYGRP